MLIINNLEVVQKKLWKDKISLLKELKPSWRIGDCSLPRIPTHGGWIGSLVTYFFHQWRLWEPELANEINQSAFLLGYFLLHRICREDCRGNGLQPCRVVHRLRRLECFSIWFLLSLICRICHEDHCGSRLLKEMKKMKKVREERIKMLW